MYNPTLNEFSEAILKSDVSGGVLIHEFLHNFGCIEENDINCFMRDMQLPLNNETLCSCNGIYQLKNHNKLSIIIHIARLSSLSATICADKGICLI